MSEEELLRGLARVANRLPSNSVDVTAGVMKSIKDELSATQKTQLELEQKSFNVFYWVSGISVAAAVILILSFSLFSNDWFSSSEYAFLNLLVSS